MNLTLIAARNCQLFVYDFVAATGWNFPLSVHLADLRFSGRSSVIIDEKENCDVWFECNSTWLSISKHIELVHCDGNLCKYFISWNLRKVISEWKAFNSDLIDSLFVIVIPVRWDHLKSWLVALVDVHEIHLPAQILHLVRAHACRFLSGESKLFYYALNLKLPKKFFQQSIKILLKSYRRIATKHSKQLAMNAGTSDS